MKRRILRFGLSEPLVKIFTLTNAAIFFQHFLCFLFLLNYKELAAQKFFSAQPRSGQQTFAGNFQMAKIPSFGAGFCAFIVSGGIIFNNAHNRFSSFYCNGEIFRAQQMRFAVHLNQYFLVVFYQKFFGAG